MANFEAFRIKHKPLISEECRAIQSQKITIINVENINLNFFLLFYFQPLIEAEFEDLIRSQETLFSLDVLYYLVKTFPTKNKPETK